MLKDEIKKKGQFESPIEEAYLNMLRTIGVLSADFERLLKERGLSEPKYNVLRILRGAGEEGIPTLEISDRMIEQAPGITRLLDRLEAKKLVRRQRCPEDRRQVLCWLTPEGTSLIERLDEPVNAADATAMAMLSQDEQKELIRLLDKVRAGLK